MLVDLLGYTISFILELVANAETIFSFVCFYLVKFHSLESKHGRMLAMILALLQRIMLKREATYPTFKWFRTKLIEGYPKLMSLLPSPAEHPLLIP
jgi:hypothetical protein